MSRKESIVSKTGSESDSLLDLYGRTPSGSKINVNTIDHDIPENMYRDEDDPEGWIHRDKLARIESEELQATSFKLQVNTGKTCLFLDDTFGKPSGNFRLEACGLKLAACSL